MKTKEGVEINLGELTLMPINYKDPLTNEELDELFTAGARQPNLGCHPCGVTEDILAKAWKLQHQPRVLVPCIFKIITNNAIEKERKEIAKKYEKILIKLKPENY